MFVCPYFYTDIVKTGPFLSWLSGIHVNWSLKYVAADHGYEMTLSELAVLLAVAVKIVRLYSWHPIGPDDRSEVTKLGMTTTSHVQVYGGAARARLNGIMVASLVTNGNNLIDIHLSDWSFEIQCAPSDVSQILNRNPDLFALGQRTEPVLELGANEGPEQWLLGPEANHRHTGLRGCCMISRDTGTRASVIGTREEQPTREGYEDAICFLVSHSAEFKGVRAGQAVTKGR
ncbi:hypothetical protein B0H14DRAFT_2617298 [Mycena olivaceomarginata]|nr:hypothetical protein B0H14DRAFT_2617298 [Mycena olivaceomarginata]